MAMETQFKLNSLNNLQIRRSNKRILITHISNIVKKDYWISPELNNKVSYYAYPEWKEYYYGRCGMKFFPFHYYVNFVKSDWDIVQTMPVNYKSHWIDSMVKNYYIDPLFKDAIIIAVQDNFSLNTMDTRCMDMLGFNIISPFCREYGINFRDSVYWFDDVFQFERYNNDRVSLTDLDYRYNVVPMKFFDKVIFNLSIMRFM